jgi:Protein of unknown function (DUF3991)/Toprim-like
MGWDDELENFKRSIDLREYAAGLGYMLDRKDSWRGSAVMRRVSDKIVIKLNGTGHYVYFSVLDDQDNGSIIDFVQRRKRLNLGEVRKELRQWLGRPAAVLGSEQALPLFPRLETTSKDLNRVEMEYRRMQDAPRHAYLERERGLSPALLASTRFAGRIRIDERGNAVFPHFDREGLCGYELKNRGFTGFAKGGEKGLWFSRTWQRDERLVFAESAIDALSYAQQFPNANARYASIGGAPNPKQPGLIKMSVLKMAAGAEIIAAMDNDDSGRDLTEVIREAVIESGRDDVSFRVHLPVTPDADWNDTLKMQPPFPIARLEP